MNAMIDVASAVALLLLVFLSVGAVLFFASVLTP